MFCTGIDQLSIDLVADQDQVVFLHQRRNLANDRGRGDGTGGVVGGHQHQYFGFGGDALFDLGGHQRKVVGFIGRHRHRYATTHGNGAVIGGKARRGDQHFITRIDQG